jgi:transposase
LRWVRALPEREAQTPRVLGVDDWALRKGKSYGTILVDLETHQPIDLLPDREADTLAQWLQAHPGVEIITRDRAGAYAEGAQRGAPEPQQVADCFHLLQNLREAVQRLMDRQQRVLRLVPHWKQQPAVVHTDNLSGNKAEIIPSSAKQAQEPLTQREMRRQTSRGRRQARYAEVQRLHQEGFSLRAIARQLKMSRHTVQRFLVSDSFPERAQTSRKASVLDPYLPFLEQQLRGGRTNGTELWRTIRTMGFQGSRSLASRWVAHHRDLAPPPFASQAEHKTRGRPPRTKLAALATPVQPLSVRRAAWLVVRHPDDLETEQRQMLNRLTELSADMERIYPLAQEFI